MVFVNEDEAKTFLIEKIAAAAIAEGQPLSVFERQMLEGCPFSGELTDPDELAEELAWRMSDLLRHAYERDTSSQETYRAAVTVLRGRKQYIFWVAHGAGLHPPSPLWLRVLGQVALFALLVVPAIVAVLIAGAGVWGALGKGPQPPGDRLGMSAAALIFGGFAAYLFALWLRPARARGSSRPGANAPPPGP